MGRWWGVVGIPFAMLGAIYGTAASPDYRMMLALWAALTFLALSIFTTCAILNRDWVRWIYVSLSTCTFIVGIDPALRSARLLL